MTTRILVVDDEPALRRTLERALRNLEYEVVSVGDPYLVYELLDAADYDLVMLDIHLPQMSGDTLAIALLRRWPALAGRILLMTGDPWALRANWPDELRQCPLLVKPFTLDALGLAVGAALTTPALQAQRKRNGG
jgi:two-component system OmpR family response regulator